MPEDTVKVMKTIITSLERDLLAHKGIYDITKPLLYSKEKYTLIRPNDCFFRYFEMSQRFLNAVVPDNFSSLLIKSVIMQIKLSSQKLIRKFFTERMEKILFKQNELRKRLNEAKEQALEMVDLKREYEMVVAENELLKRQLEQYRM